MGLNISTLKSKFINGKAYNLDTVIKNAYRDLQLRTIKGHNGTIQKRCTEYLKAQFSALIQAQPINDNQFEDEHEKICDGFLNTINSYTSIEPQKYGKAQKVVNIIFKFLVAHEIWKNEDQCHMPVDSFVLRWLYGKDTYNGTSWSNLSYSDYVKIQDDIKKKIKKSITVGAKSNITVNNRAEADYYVWYVTKVEKNYKDTKNAIKKMAKSIDNDDTECVKKEAAEELIREIDQLKEKIKVLWKIK